VFEGAEKHLTNLTVAVIYFILVAVTALTILFAYVRDRHKPVTKHLIRLCAISIAWQVLSASFYLISNEFLALWAFDFKIMFVAFAPVQLLMLSITFYRTKPSRNTTLIFGLLCIIPAVTSVLAITSPFHNFLRTELFIEQSEPLRILRNVRGPWFWVHSGYSYIMMVSSIIAIIYQHSKLPKGFRLPSAFVAVGSATALFSNIYVILSSYTQAIDITLVGLSTALVLTYVGVAISDESGLLMIARDNIFAYLEDYIFILNTERTILEINPAARRWLHSLGIEEGVKHIGDLVARAANDAEILDNVAPLQNKDTENLDNGESLRNKDAGNLDNGESLQNKDAGNLDNGESLQNKDAGNLDNGEALRNKDAGNLDNGESLQNKDAGNLDNGEALQNKEDISRGRGGLRNGKRRKNENRMQLDVVHARATTQKMEFSVMEKDGVQRHYQLSETEIINSGKVKGYCIMIFDITGAKQLLEAKAASEAKSAFLSNVSHEIRTPLNAIVGMTTIGLSASDPERMKNCFTRIEDATKHLLRVINDVLDMAKIEDGKFELSSEEFDFEDMLQRVINIVKINANEKKQALVLNIDGNMPKNFVGDDQRLAQVVTNLIGNAVKFTPENGSIEVDSQFLGEEDGVCTIQIDVKDSGIGVSPEQQAKLFESFQQADSSTARKFGGTGLGLTISRNIVEMMGGRIWIESELGKGATFSFSVQLKKSAGVSKESALDSGEKANEYPVDELGEAGNVAQTPADIFQGRRILLADDVEINREIVQILLEPTMLEVDCVENGIEAVKMFSESPEKYDMILMDVQMPEMDGYEATRTIRALDIPKARSVPIIALTANVLKEDVEKCIESGMDDHLGKPLDYDDVIRQLRRYLLDADDLNSGEV